VPILRRRRHRTHECVRGPCVGEHLLVQGVQKSLRDDEVDGVLVQQLHFLEEVPEGVGDRQRTLGDGQGEVSAVLGFAG